jgi:hypothetical protein
VIPVLVDGAPMPCGEDLPVSMQGLNGWQARSLPAADRHRQVELKILVSDIAKIAGLTPRPEFTERSWVVTCLKVLLITIGTTVTFLVVAHVNFGWDFPTEQVSVIALAIFIIAILIARLRSRLRRRRHDTEAEGRLGLARRDLRRLLVLSCGVPLLQAPVDAQIAAGHNETANVVVVCTAERSVVYVGEMAFVRAWVTDADGRPVAGTPRFAWRAAKGEISGGERALWRLDDVTTPMVGGVAISVPIIASVDVDVAGHGAGRCELEILLTARPHAADLASMRQRSERLTARTLLLRGMTEPLEYGLHSYLLFSTRQKDDTERERYLKTIEAYIRVLVPLEDFLEQNVRASQLNVTMFPAAKSVSLPANLDDPSRARSVASDLLDVYDYARARVLLSDLGIHTIGGGPYLISRETGSTRVSGGRLLIDMTGVSPSLIWDWMTWFSWLSGQERSWSETTLKRLGLNLRNIIAVTEKITPVVFESVGRWVYILKQH